MNASTHHTSGGMDRSAMEIMIDDTVQRIFGAQVTNELRLQAQQGHWPQGLWQQVTEAGLPLALCSAERGGSEANWLDVLPVFSALGRHAVPLPLAETVAAAWLLERAGIAPPAEPVAIAPQESALAAGSDGRASGSLHGVPWAGGCRWLLATVSPSAWGLFDLAACEVRREPCPNMAGEPRAHVHMSAAMPSARLASPGALSLRHIGALARSGMLVGALESALGCAVAHANQREQFGRPLSRFQALQHGLASAAGELLSAKVATRVAFGAMRGDHGMETAAFDIAVAKVISGQAASRVAALSHQIHGAMGFTQEHALHHATRRLWSWRQEYGSDAEWAQRLGRSTIGAPAGGFWPAVTGRCMLE